MLDTLHKKVLQNHPEIHKAQHYMMQGKPNSVNVVNSNGSTYERMLLLSKVLGYATPDHEPFTISRSNAWKLLNQIKISHFQYFMSRLYTCHNSKAMYNAPIIDVIDPLPESISLAARYITVSGNVICNNLNPHYRKNAIDYTEFTYLNMKLLNTYPLDKSIFDLDSFQDYKYSQFVIFDQVPKVYIPSVVKSIQSSKFYKPSYIGIIEELTQTHYFRYLPTFKKDRNDN
jgi:hypothetical protein